MDSTSDEDFEWDTDGDGGGSDGGPGGAAETPSRPEVGQAGPSRPQPEEAGPSRPQLVVDFIDMGFSEELVLRAVEENGKEDREAILELLLTLSAIDESSPSCRPSSGNSSASTSDEDFKDNDLDSVDSSGEEYAIEDVAPHEEQLLALVRMGFSKEDASSAIERCGLESSILELVDSIHAAQLAKIFEDEEAGQGNILYYSHKEKKMWRETIDFSNGKKRRVLEDHRLLKRKNAKLSEKEVDHIKRDHTRLKMKNSLEDYEDSCNLPNPMVGFGLPGDQRCITNRKLPDAALGPPYFYYENVALAPKGVWGRISRFLDVEPEFVDSKHFCAAARKRGYIHNLPIQNRFPLLPIPPKTIHGALPRTKRWWPKWDRRLHLNCLQTCIASARLTDRIRTMLSAHDDPPPLNVQQDVLKECRKWNLVWVGSNKVAPLEPHEIEGLLGFPTDHTRGGGSSRTERYRSLGNSFQIDTVAYHLSVLKEMFPSGMNVLSLFSGIGGAEVALHRLGIHLKNVVSVEISETNRNIVRCWWEQTGQTGELIHIADIQQLNGDKLENMIKRYGGFDLVIGGSPCNNLAGSNRVARNGLEGEHSSLFFDYFRILELVKCVMGRNM